MKTTPAKKLRLLPTQSSFYGGELMKKRKGREGARPLAVRKSMHVVLRSTKAKGERSLLNPRNKKKVKDILIKHANTHHVRLISFANVGNHLHLHIQLGYRDGYARFIRAITAAIAMHVMKWNRWSPATMQTQNLRAGITKTGVTKAGVTKAGVTKTRIADTKLSHKPTKEKFWDFRPYTNIVTSWTGFLKLRSYVRINQLEGQGLPRRTAELIVKGLKAGP